MFNDMHTEAPVPQNDDEFTPEEEGDLLDMLGGASDDESEPDEAKLQTEQTEYLTRMMGVTAAPPAPPPQPEVVAEAQSPFEIASTIFNLTTNIETTEQCSQIQSEVTKLVAAVRAKSRALGGVQKAGARADGAPRQRAPKGTAKATPAGLFNVAMRAEATSAYMEGRRSAKELKTDTKAGHIQSILAEMWKAADPETRAEFKRRADEKNASA